METQAVEVIETEVVLEEAMSLNHARLTSRITWLLSAAYDDQYDVLAELEFELSTGRLKPDVSIIPKQIYNWREDIIRFLHPPITAIEILSPTQAFDAVATKINKLYFPAGVQSAWLVVPFVKTVHLFLADGSINTVTSGTLHDPACNVSLEMSAVFK